MEDPQLARGPCEILVAEVKQHLEQISKQRGEAISVLTGISCSILSCSGLSQTLLDYEKAKTHLFIINPFVTFTLELDYHTFYLSTDQTMN